jgi:hypothetical protein
MKNKLQVAQAQIISFRLIPLVTPISFRCTVPLSLVIEVRLKMSMLVALRRKKERSENTFTLLYCSANLQKNGQQLKKEN